ncbi:TPA: hypothetical protein ACSP1Y_004783, partial [Aeromonas hydrophila]
KRKNVFDVESTLKRDDIGRVQSERVGNLTINKTFTADNRDLVTKLTVAGNVIGHRAYDSLGRVVSEAKGELTTYYRYDTLTDKPSVVTQPGGQKIEYTLAVELNEIIAITTNDDTASFEFDNRGLLAATQNSAAQQHFTYYYNGLLKSESLSGQTANYTYSRQGQLLTLIDYMGKIERRRYDSYHRLNKVELDTSMIDLEYDAFGRVQNEHISSQMNPTISHHYKYDEQGRLANKISTINGGLYLSQTYTYIKEMRLASKMVTDATGNSTIETYSYDDYGRVVAVHWRGSESPDYHGMGSMLSQLFTFDNMGNITQVDTLCIRDSEQQRDLASYTYESGQLIRMDHSWPELASVALSYDNNGNLSGDEQGRRYLYNALGQLTQVWDASGALLSEYSYNTTGQQIQQSVPAQPPIELFYGLGHLLNERQGVASSRLFIVEGRTLSRLVTVDGHVTETGLVTDLKGSVLREVCGQADTLRRYTPYGEKSVSAS